jgi:hypothetical protein
MISKNNDLGVLNQRAMLQDKQNKGHYFQDMQNKRVMMKIRDPMMR